MEFYIVKNDAPICYLGNDASESKNDPRNRAICDEVLCEFGCWG
jgi:hypothetical protein